MPLVFYEYVRMVALFLLHIFYNVNLGYLSSLFKPRSVYIAGKVNVFAVMITAKNH